MSRHIPDIVFQQGLPNVEQFDGRTRTLLILDDLMNDVDESVSTLFTRGSHHLNVSVIFITQNIFQSSKYGRTINLNAHYLILFKNPRDAAQISYLARQMYPKKSNFLIEAFNDATSRPFGYLFLDLKADTDEEIRVRTNVLPGEIDNGQRLLRPFVYRPVV